MFELIRNKLPSIMETVASNYWKKRDLGIWRFFQNTHPEYLARHYWWAYLWRPGIWFFDHQTVINATLFGNYRTLSHRALDSCLDNRPEGRFLQLTCVYGELTPNIVKAMDDNLYLADVSEKQLALARRKLDNTDRNRLIAARMKAEQLAYRDDAFSSVMIFFLLHELPYAAIEQTLSEAIRVLKTGGRLVIADYSPLPEHHVLWKSRLVRTLLLQMEPFLEAFWHRDLITTIDRYMAKHGKKLRTVDKFYCFDGFYRLYIFELGDNNDK